MNFERATAPASEKRSSGAWAACRRAVQPRGSGAGRGGRVLRRCTDASDYSQQPTFVDPQAAICWSANLQPQIKNTFKVDSLIKRGSGESFQLAFHGPGFVVVQPSEGQPVVASS